MNFSTFQIGSFIISVGGIILLIGLCISTLVLILTSRRKELSVDFLSHNLPALILTPLFFGRIGAFLQLYEIVEKKIAEQGLIHQITIFLKYFFSFQEGGFDSVWVVIGFIVTFAALAIWKKEPLLKWLDAFALPGILMVIFIHIAGFFSSWGYGKPVNEDFIFAVSYDLPNVRFAGPIHPVQIYGAILFSALFYGALQLWYKKIFSRKAWNPGVYFFSILLMGSLINGFLEFFRGDSVQIIFEQVRMPQMISFGVVFFSIIFLIIHTHEKHD